MKDKVRLRKYLLKYKGTLILAILLSLIYVFIDVFLPYLTGKCIDLLALFISTKVENGTSIDIFSGANGLYFYLEIGALLICLMVLFNYLFDVLISLYGEKITKDMKDDLYDKIHHLPISYIDSKSHGDLISRLVNDLDNVSLAIISTFKQLFTGIITLITTIVFMFYLNYLLAILILILTPLCFILSFKIAKGSHSLFKKQAGIQGDISSKIIENLNNIDIIKSFNYEDNSFNEFNEVNNNLFKVGQKAQFISSLTNPSTRLVNNLIYAFVGILGTILCVLAYPNETLLGASISIGLVSSFLQYANKFSKPFNEMSSCISEIQTGLSSFSRVNEVLNENDDIDVDSSIKLNSIDSLSFSNLYFSYRKDKPLIENFNFKVNKFDKVALVGPTGCGKTTIINLIMRFYDPISGEIKLNDINTKEISKKEVRNHIGLVLQDTWIFKGTVLDNIKYGKDDASLDEVIECCKKSGAYSFISKLKNGFNTIISDDSSLSSGEKQLIAISRVMLSLKDIIILDEATSNIDTRSEAKLTLAFDKLIENKTSFVVAHRLSTIINATKIIVLKDGHIIDVDTHQNLLKKKGFYYELFNAQFENNS